MKSLRVLILFSLLLAACNLPASDNCTRPDVFCVGLVTAYGRVDDHGMNQSAWGGIQQALNEGLIDKAEAIETIDSRDQAKNIATFAEAGYDVIVTVSYALGEETRLAADHWPDTRFIGVDQPQTDPLPNLTGLTFPEDKGGFLAGVLAAEVTRTKKIAALCEVETIPEMWRTCEGFRAGVRYVSPDLTLRIIYHPNHNPDDWFNDPTWGEEQIPSLANFGADILFAAGGTTAIGALEAAAQNGMYVIGADEDLYYQIKYQDLVLGSAIKQVGPGVYGLIRLAVEGTLTSGEFRGEYALGPFHSLERLIQPTVRQRIGAIQQGLIDGSIKTGVSPEP